MLGNPGRQKQIIQMRKKMNEMGLEKKIFSISSPDTAENGTQKRAVLKL